MTASAKPLLDDETVELLAGSLRAVFAGGRDVPAALADLGWDEVHGLDPARTTTMLFRAQGRALASSRILDRVVIEALGVAADAVLYPNGILLGPPVDGQVVAVLGEDVTLVDAGDLVDPQPLVGFGADSGWLRVQQPSTGRPAPGETLAALAVGRRAVAAELIGVCESALELATAHVTTREQYGRAIGSFQAVRHRLAEGYVTLVSAQEVLDAAWAEPADDVLSAMAKARAGRAQADLMRTLIQVFGAMGLSKESEVHRHVTRAACLDTLLGGHQQLTAALGARLVDGSPLTRHIEI